MCLMSLSLVILLYSFQRTKAPVFCLMGKEISSMCITGHSDSFVLPSIFIAKVPDELKPKARASGVSTDRLCCLSWFLILKFVANCRGILGGGRGEQSQTHCLYSKPHPVDTADHSWDRAQVNPFPPRTGTPMCCTTIFQSAMDQ